MQTVTSGAVYETIFDTDASRKNRRKGDIGIIGGTYGFSTSSVGSFIDNTLCGQQADGSYGIGGMIGGSIDVSGNNGSLGIPDGWLNFIYIPHRTGVDQSSSGDNHLYGTLIMTQMTSNTSNLYIIHRINGVNYTAYVK